MGFLNPRPFIVSE